MAHVADWKKKAVDEITALAKSYPVIAVSNIESLPAAQFQEIRTKMRDTAVFRVAKLNLLDIAFGNSGVKGIDQLEAKMDGPTAIVFSKAEPFKLFKLLKKSRSKAAIKPGQKAPFDLVVPKGDTGLPPGPALGELKTAGIDARIDGGSIKVMKDSTVAKAGQVVTAEQAAALTKLGIKPLEIGISLDAALENGMIFTSEILDISEEQTIANIQKAYMNGLNLSFNAGYFTKTNIELFVQKASREARALGVEASILEKGVIELLLGKASLQAKAISSMVK
jgi:large subunit ribosomal protein L10